MPNARSRSSVRVPNPATDWGGDMRRRTLSRKPLIVTAALFLAWATQLEAGELELCREVAEVVLRPTKIIQKVRKEGLKCLVVPLCCGPTWSMHGECYVIKEVEGAPEKIEV